MMFFGDVVNRGVMPALDKMLAFTQARQRMLAENVANIDNPHYRTKQLDARAFQKALREALETQKETGSATFRVPGSREFHQDELGRLVVTPGEVPPENVLFHDDTNARIERQMQQMAENTMMHQVATELLRERFEGLRKAIRGQVT